MKAGDYTINTFNFRKILNAVLNPYVIIPEMNTTSVKMNDGLDYDFASMTKREALEVLAVNAQGMPMMFPLDLQMDGGDWWRLPYEPLITVTGKNTIVKKKVSKGAVRGSIKERWCQDDYSISIEGLLMGSDGQYPKEDVMKLPTLLRGSQTEGEMSSVRGVFHQPDSHRDIRFPDDKRTAESGV